MSRNEIKDCQKTLAIVSEEIQNLIKHFKLQIDNYRSTVQSYNDMVEVALNEKEKHIFELETENSKLKSALISSDDEATDVYKQE
ncbi:MAG: hypothetical protein ABW185_11705 [Sedimenticola sp.]